VDSHQADKIHSLGGSLHRKDSLSIIIPTLSDPERIKPLLAFLEVQLRQDDEILLVHGGGDDGRPAQDLSRRVRCIYSSRGRGIQLDAGATEARNGVFFFLHDDGLPPAGFADSVRSISRAPHISLGCFELSFHPATKTLALIAAWANLRTRVLGLPYGDQGLFCRRDIFEKAGGFKRMLLMEDVDFVRRCRQWGDLMVIPHKIHSSPGRYTRKGVLRASLQNHLIMLLHQLGVSHEKLYSLYYKR
jgi:rSAM/selenodomain-associated transferase 2